MEEKIKELENRIITLETTVAAQDSIIAAIRATADAALVKSKNLESGITKLEKKVVEQKGIIDLKVDKYRIVEELNLFLENQKGN